MASKKKMRKAATKGAAAVKRPGKRRPAPAPAAAAAGRSVLEPRAAILANLLVFAVLAYGWLIEGRYADFYYRSVQEDEYLEWATFWGFIVATVVFVVAALRQRRASGRLPWFLFGLGAFCFFFAMEEISWGQRLLGYRPPDYFLAENFQQELNIHNVTSTALRKLTLKLVILGYGVVLAIAGAIPELRRRFESLGVFAPPAALVPSFLAAFLLYDKYPWKFSGEWVELMLAFGFLFVSLAHAGGLVADRPLGRRRMLATLAGAWLVVAAVGTAHAALSRHQRDADPAIVAAATRELEALKADFDSGLVESDCNVHRRLFTFKEKSDQDGLIEGRFAELVEQGLPESRMNYLLDPWNTPYWIRDRCSGDRRVTFIYSFGPNRKRDSDRWQILGDDVGVYIRELG